LSSQTYEDVVDCGGFGAWQRTYYPSYPKCPHDEMVIGHITTSGGQKQYKYGCSVCGGNRGGNSGLRRINMSLQEIADADANDHNAVEEDYRERSNKYWEAVRDLMAQHEQRLRSESNDAWNQWRLARYKLEDWWGVNGWVERIMKRSGGLCECCLNAKAREVHHLTYDHLYKERGWELVAICEDCHKRITIERRIELGRDHSDIK
jgi:hypothetical protein